MLALHPDLFTMRGRGLSTRLIGGCLFIMNTEKGKQFLPQP